MTKRPRLRIMEGVSTSKARNIFTMGRLMVEIAEDQRVLDEKQAKIRIMLFRLNSAAWFRHKATGNPLRRMKD